jgi:hypothetical protein
MSTKLTRYLFPIITLPSLFVLNFLKNPVSGNQKKSTILLSNQNPLVATIDTEATRFTKIVLIKKTDETINGNAGTVFRVPQTGSERPFIHHFFSNIGK